MKGQTLHELPGSSPSTVEKEVLLSISVALLPWCSPPASLEGCAVYPPGEGAECWCGKLFYTELQERGRMSFWRFFISGFKNFLSGVWRVASAQARSPQICPLPPALCFQLHPSLHLLAVDISYVIACQPDVNNQRCFILYVPGKSGFFRGKQMFSIAGVK